jgi:hypothetical protein
MHWLYVEENKIEKLLVPAGNKIFKEIPSRDFFCLHKPDAADHWLVNKHKRE